MMVKMAAVARDGGRCRVIVFTLCNAFSIRLQKQKLYQVKVIYADLLFCIAQFSPAFLYSLQGCGVFTLCLDQPSLQVCLSHPIKFFIIFVSLLWQRSKVEITIPKSNITSMLLLMTVFKYKLYLSHPLPKSNAHSPSPISPFTTFDPHKLHPPFTIYDLYKPQ